MKKSPISSVVLIVAMIASVMWGSYAFYGRGTLTAPVTLVFAPNTSFVDIIDTMAKSEVVRHPLLVKAILFIGGNASRIKAGEYNFPAYVSEKEAIDMLIFGKTVTHHLTIKEGMMTSEIILLLQNNELLSGDITLDVKEGDLLPETYHFSRGDKRNELLNRMRHAMQKTLTEAWEGRAENLPFSTPQQALTLASIVEKETGLASERQRVAAVYINRLRKGMLLQADPTTAYAVTGGKEKLSRPLTYADLAIVSPYNTYKSKGLPPGPIANPGKASIIATLHPIVSDELYFVATGSGGHNFARTEKEHNENVKKYREMKKLQSTQ